MKALLFLLTLLVFWGCSQKNTDEVVESNPKLDSIQEWIAAAKKGKELSLDDRQYYLGQAQTLASELPNDTVRIEQLSSISLIYKNLKDSLNFRKSNSNVLKQAEDAKLFMALGNSHWDLAHFFESYAVLDSAFYHYQKAFKSFERLNDDVSLKSEGIMLYNMARIQDSYKDYLGAEISVSSALKIFDQLEDDYRLHNCYNVFGTISNGRNDSEKALYYYGKAGEYLENLEPSKKQNLVWINQNNIASALMNMKEYERAKTIYKNLSADAELKQKNPEMYAKAISSLAFTILKSEHNYEASEQLLNEAISLDKENSNLFNLARINQFYAELMAAEGDTVQAIEKAKESFSVAKETYNNDRSLEVLKLLVSIDANNATSYFKEYVQLNDAIQEEERTKRDKFARIRLETDQVIEANQILLEENQAWIAAVMGMLLFGVAALVIVTLYISNSRLKFRQQQQESNQEIYNLMLSQQGKFEEGRQLEQKRISEELHDGILGEMLGTRLILTGLNEREDPASVEQRAQLIEKLRGIEEEIRTISHELNNASYEKFHNFIVSLEDLIEGIQESSGISCSFSYDREVSWDNLLGDIKINAYRIVQEALKNCVKHANSQHVSIAFQSVGDKLKLIITDNGVGFDMNRGKKGIGLRNIISRTKKIKGNLDIDSKKGKGTTISVTIPAKYIQSDVTLNTKTVNA